MQDVQRVDMRPLPFLLPACRTVQAKGHDLHSLIFSFLDELLFLFHAELFVCSRIEITAVDLEAFTLDARGCVPARFRRCADSGPWVRARPGCQLGPRPRLPRPWTRRWGELFDRERHAAGTEIKAITYSAMNVVESGERADVWVIVDI